jgi:hypothetical protein
MAPGMLFSPCEDVLAATLYGYLHAVSVARAHSPKHEDIINRFLIDYGQLILVSVSTDPEMPAKDL